MANKTNLVIDGTQTRIRETRGSLDLNTGMLTIDDLPYGKATVEIVHEQASAQLREQQGLCTVVGPVEGVAGLVWIEIEIYSITRAQEGYVYYPTKGGGSSGWLPARNVRNFNRSPDNTTPTSFG